MSEDRTMEKSHTIKINTEFMESFIKQQTAILESFLNEFCKVNGIKETELKNHLSVASCPPDHSIMAVNVDDTRDIKFGVKTNIKTKDGSFFPVFEVFGEYTDCKDNYPETTALITSIKNGGNSGK